MNRRAFFVMALGAPLAAKIGLRTGPTEEQLTDFLQWVLKHPSVPHNNETYWIVNTKYIHGLEDYLRRHA